MRQIRLRFLKETEEVDLIYKFCQWQGIKVEREVGPLAPIRIQFQWAPDEEPTETVYGFVAFVQKAAEMGILLC